MRYDLLSHEESNIIVETILSLEDYVKSTGPGIYFGPNDNSLTGRFHCYNFLSNEVIGSILKPKLKEIFKVPVVVQCWANIFRRGEGIGEHMHSDDSVDKNGNLFGSANIFLYGDPTIGTYYNGVKSINKIGEMTLFPKTMYHFVPQNPTDDIRVSMAFDFYIGSDKFMNELVTSEPHRYIIVSKTDSE